MSRYTGPDAEPTNKLFRSLFSSDGTLLPQETLTNLIATEDDPPQMIYESLLLNMIILHAPTIPCAQRLYRGMETNQNTIARKMAFEVDTYVHKNLHSTSIIEDGAMKFFTSKGTRPTKGDDAACCVFWYVSVLKMLKV